MKPIHLPTFWLLLIIRHTVQLFLLLHLFR
uniref:Uncharacterized protein n=1 Tax=Siphoviridae sp. ctamP19 TaxID=2827896 RepID=A0A8S5TNC9_9CAUD|nr:MAG TPA: hypothetical protein [Siphoviridae sp. ctamP19]